MRGRREFDQEETQVSGWMVNLINRARAGDRGALGDLLQGHGPKIRKILRGAIPKRWQALLSIDDVLQQTYTDAFLDVGTFVSRGEGAFRAWLVTLAKRNLLDAVKAMKAARRGGNRQRVEARSTQESVQVLVDWLETAMVGVRVHTSQRYGFARSDPPL